MSGCPTSRPARMPVRHPPPRRHDQGPPHRRRRPWCLDRRWRQSEDLEDCNVIVLVHNSVALADHT
eukprot:11192043-Lingulodinium_polyedra.AAC.1